MVPHDLSGFAVPYAKLPPGTRSAFGRDRGSQMATRQQRLNAFLHEGDPPMDRPLELLCEDHVGTYVIPFPCRWMSEYWQSAETGERILATVLGWRARAKA